MPYVRPQAAKPQPGPIHVEMLNVELTHDPLPDIEPPPADALFSPTAPDAVVPPLAPQAVAVAMPSESIAFALPVEGPVRVVNLAQASYSRAESPSAPTATAPPVQKLTFGYGAAKQPAPEYPLVAQNAGQEGVVNVRFVVAENGRVTAAEAVAPSPWPLLTDSALRTIRNRWRFPGGNLRAYEVAIRFVLPK
jgi:protein TonB